MPTTVTLPDELTQRLQVEADRQHQSLDQLVAELLTVTLTREEAAAQAPLVEGGDNGWPSLEAVVAKIKATPPNRHAFQPATTNLAELLTGVEEDPLFDEQAWNHEWQKVEQLIEAIDHADDIAEGREA